MRRRATLAARHRGYRSSDRRSSWRGPWPCSARLTRTARRRRRGRRPRAAWTAAGWWTACGPGWRWSRPRGGPSGRSGSAFMVDSAGVDRHRTPPRCGRVHDRGPRRGRQRADPRRAAGLGPVHRPGGAQDPRRRRPLPRAAPPDRGRGRRRAWASRSWPSEPLRARRHGHGGRRLAPRPAGAHRRRHDRRRHPRPMPESAPATSVVRWWTTAATWSA